MPQGFYTIEQYTCPKNGRSREWVAVQHLPFGQSLTRAEQALAQRGQSGLYRLVHTQRIVWAEPDGGALRLRKSHASSPANLGEIERMFDRNGGRYPTEEVRKARRLTKRKRDA
jgi:hypothetical protein